MYTNSGFNYNMDAVNKQIVLRLCRYSNKDLLKETMLKQQADYYDIHSFLSYTNQRQKREIICSMKQPS